MKIPSTILGVYGGMGPAASAEFMRLLAVRAPAGRDQEHPIVYLYSNAQTPDRSSAIMGQGTSPAPALREGLLKLCQWGAGLLAVPCNTAHFFIDQFRSELPVPLVHIVEVTVDDAVKLNPGGCWIISTGGTQHCGIYAREAERRHYRAQEPEQKYRDQAIECIRLVKANKLKESGELMRRLASDLWDKEEMPLMCACTELPLAYDASGLPESRQISSLRSLADACLKRLYQ